jgi:phosphinothricin acetyltransferase
MPDQRGAPPQEGKGVGDGVAGGVARPVKLRLATSGDAGAICEIYAPFVVASNVSFETVPPDTEAMRARIESGGDLYPWLVAVEESGAVLGYAYATAFRPRPAYRFAVETSVYLAPEAQGRGIGSRLYKSLIGTLEAQGFAQAIAAITLPNAPSICLHEALGFAPAGTYRKVGYKYGEWHDVGLWQRALAPAEQPPCEPRPYSDTSLTLL